MFIELIEGHQQGIVALEYNAKGGSIEGTRPV